MVKRRNTATKEAVLTLLISEKKAMSQDAIVKKMAIDVDRATVYRILNRFCEDGIVHKIVADDGKQYFATCSKADDDMAVPGNHFHFRCTNCETIECLPSSVEYAVPKNYSVKQLNCVLIGICNDCS